MKLDAVAKRILAALDGDAGYDLAHVARRTGCSEGVVFDRIQSMRDAGIIQGFQARIDPAAAGPSHEALVTGVPTERTDPPGLRALCHASGVTRVWTLASRTSVAFTFSGPDVPDIQEGAQRLADAAGLIDVRVTLIVNTFLDRGAGTPGRLLSAKDRQAFAEPLAIDP